MSRVIGRDCDCEDFPCCGHGITENDQRAEREWAEYERMFEDDRLDNDDEDDSLTEDDYPEYDTDSLIEDEVSL